MNIWITYIWTAEWRIMWMKIIAVIYATFAVAKKACKKIQACTGFEPFTSAIPASTLPIKVKSQVGADRWIGSL